MDAPFQSLQPGIHLLPSSSVLLPSSSVLLLSSSVLFRLFIDAMHDCLHHVAHVLHHRIGLRGGGRRADEDAGTLRRVRYHAVPLGGEQAPAPVATGVLSSKSTDNNVLLSLGFPGLLLCLYFCGRVVQIIST
jgi:hypothetical protein